MTVPPTFERRLCILDVGHGNCAVLVAGPADVLVIDVGRANALLEFLRHEGITSIRTIYLSHADEDHIGGLVGILASNSISVEKVVVNTDASKATRTWDDLAYELDRAHQTGRMEFKPSMVHGDGQEIDDLEVRVLGPSHYLVAKGVGSRDRLGRRITSNSISAVIRVSVSGRHVAILPGDIDGVGLDNLPVQGDDMKAPVIVYPHHGGRPGTSDIRSFAEKLLKETSPEVVVFSIGRGRRGSPNRETVRVLREVVPAARIVCTQLSEQCSKTLPKGTPTHLSNMYALGRADGACCGGTVVVPLDSGSNQYLRPSDSAHTEFIRSNVETPLCLQDS